MLIRLSITLVALAYLGIQWWAKPKQITKKTTREAYPALNLIRLTLYFIFGIASTIVLAVDNSGELTYFQFWFTQQCPEFLLYLIEIVGWLAFALGWLLALSGRTRLANMWRPGQLTKNNINPYHQLIKSGSYSLVRHPIYLGECLMMIGLLLIYMLWPIAIFTLDRLIICFMRIEQEERDLASKFGQSWLEYKNNVPKYIPKLGVLKWKSLNKKV